MSVVLLQSATLWKTFTSALSRNKQNRDRKQQQFTLTRLRRNAPINNVARLYLATITQQQQQP